MGTLYNLTQTIATGSLLDYAYSEGILATEVALSQIIPLYSAITSECDKHYPIFRWAAEHSSFNVLKLTNSDISEFRCFANTTCASSSTFSAILFTFSLENTGRFIAPASTFDFWISWENTEDYTFTISEVYEISHSLFESELYSNYTIPFNIIEQTSIHYHIQVTSYLLDARTAYDIVVKVERTKNPDTNCFDELEVNFSGKIHFTAADNDTDFEVGSTASQGVILVTSEISTYDIRTAHYHVISDPEKEDDWTMILGLSLMGLGFLAVCILAFILLRRNIRLRRMQNDRNVKEFKSIELGVEDVRLEIDSK